MMFDGVLFIYFVVIVFVIVVVVCDGCLIEFLDNGYLASMEIFRDVARSAFDFFDVVCGDDVICVCLKF